MQTLLQLARRRGTDQYSVSPESSIDSRRLSTQHFNKITNASALDAGKNNKLGVLAALDSSK